MAKWGEGDPRWIVEERKDAKNVNNWHWSEKNATQWSKNEIKKLLVGLIVENKEYYFEITRLSKLEGEATTNNRKGKVIVFYEWDLEMNWKGNLKSEDNKYDFKGNIHVPNLSEENEVHELDILVSVEKNTASAIKLKEFIRFDCANMVREKLKKYIIDLRTEYSKDLILPTKKDMICENVAQPNSVQCKTPIKETVITHEEKRVVVTAYGSLELEDEFFCTPYDLYQILMTRDLVAAFSRSPVSVDPVIGGQMSMFGDTVLCIIDNLECPSKIGVRWRHRSWPLEHWSVVEIRLRATDNGTLLGLTQTGVPHCQMVATKTCWLQNYFLAIKMTFGYGGRMF